MGMEKDFENIDFFLGMYTNHFKENNEKSFKIARIVEKGAYW